MMELSKWLGTIGSHTAYDEDTLKELEALEGYHFRVTVMHPGHVAIHTGKYDLTIGLSGHTGEQFAKEAQAEKRDPKGPMSVHPLATQSMILVGGWQISNALCRLLELPVSDKSGRGFAHRENMRTIREWEERQS